jgi:hypothetical protein
VEITDTHGARGSRASTQRRENESQTKERAPEKASRNAGG